jgi:hypothetical protein
MDWDEYVLKYFGMDEKTLSQTAWRLEEVLLHEGILVGEEAYTYFKYAVLENLKKLRSKSEPTPRIYEEVLRLYDIDIPVFIVPPEMIKKIYRGKSTLVGFFPDTSYDPCRPIAILIDGSYSEDGVDVNEVRLKLLLHGIALVVFQEEVSVLELVLKWFADSVKQLSERFLDKDVEEKEEVSACLDYVVSTVRDALIHRWAVEQFSKLRVYLNDDATGWRSPLTFEDVSREFDRGMGFGMELFRPPLSMYDGEWPPPRRERRVRRTAIVLDEEDFTRMAPAYEHIFLAHRKCLERSRRSGRRLPK